MLNSVYHPLTAEIPPLVVGGDITSPMQPFADIFVDPNPQTIELQTFDTPQTEIMRKNLFWSRVNARTSIIAAVFHGTTAAKTIPYEPRFGDYLNTSLCLSGLFLVNSIYSYARTKKREDELRPFCKPIKVSV